MARYGPSDVIFKIATVAVPDVTVIGGDDLEALLEEVTPFTVAYETHAAVGVKKLGVITVSAPYSTTAGDLTPVIDAAGVGGTIACVILYGGSKTTSFSGIVQKITRVTERGKLVNYQALIQPTGTITEA